MRGGEREVMPMNLKTRRLNVVCCLLVSTFPAWAESEPSAYAGAIDAIRAVENEGRGNEAAAEAWRDLVKGDIDSVLPLMEAMNGANGLAANWLLSAVEAVIDREVAAGKVLPVDQLGEFLMDTRHDPKARRLAFELLQRADADTAALLIPGMIADPSTALRREAIGELLGKAKALVDEKKTLAAGVIYRQALGSACDVDQIETASKAMKELGIEVDLPKHFGFLMHWAVIGPFDNTDRKGFDTVYPPENGVDLNAELDGKLGKVRWAELVTSNEYGVVDMNTSYGMQKDVTAYAFTEYNAASAGPAEIRLGCKNAWKIWLNGELVFGRDEYHRGKRIDQYKLSIQLKEGKNSLLVKLCQNEQEEDWTKEWEFQLRLCDATGTALLATDRPPTPKKSTRKKPVIKNS